MSDSLQMFMTLHSAFYQLIPPDQVRDVRLLRTLAWAVVGICLSETVNFSRWGEVVLSEAKYASSHQRRFRRFLKNARVKPKQLYGWLLKAALKQWSLQQTLFLGLDVSDLKNGCVLIRVALIYRGRAVPVCWKVMSHKGTSVAYQDYKKLLKRVLKLLPSGHPVVLLADRGFVHAKLVKFCRKHHWGYRLRAKCNTVIGLADHRTFNFVQLCPPKGHAHFYHQVQIMGENIGPVHVALANPQNPDEEPWYVISNEPTSVTTLTEYALRFDMEEGFLDDKSGGFQLEGTRLTDPKVLERLLLVLAIAVLHLTSVGTEVVKQDYRRWVDTHWDRGQSYLKIGWNWLRQQFRKQWPIFPPFTLDPEPDPEPAMASRRQADKKKRPPWVVTYFADP